MTNVKEIYEELKVFRRNLSKDNTQRRENFRVLEYKLSVLNGIEKEFCAVKDRFNAEPNPQILNQIKGYVKEIEAIIVDCRKILSDRLEVTNVGIIDTKEKTNIVIMAEKFDLRTAASLLPRIDKSEDVIIQLIDAIELYNELLDANGKQSLINYVLKTRLTQNAKIRLAASYNSVEELVKDMRTHLLTKKSAIALSNNLNTCRQNTNTVDEFGQEIEKLVNELTISQSEGDTDATSVLTKVNEKLAISAFANGLNNQELRTVIKARNYHTLQEAICGAKTEEGACQQNHHVYQFNKTRDRDYQHNYNNSWKHCFKGNQNKFNNRGRGYSKTFTSNGNSRYNEPKRHSDQMQNRNYENNRSRMFTPSRQNSHHNTSRYNNRAAYYVSKSETDQDNNITAKETLQPDTHEDKHLKHSPNNNEFFRFFRS